MHYFHWIAGTILALAWFSRIVDAAIGMPSVADISKPEWDRNPAGAAGNPASGNPLVSIIVPARNEEKDIEQSLTRLLELDYDNYEVIAVNDRSTDRTGEIMEAVTKNPHFSQKTREMGHPVLRVIHHRELPAGWLGKTHAMWTATNEAKGDWLLFTDADVQFKPDSVRRAMAYAEAERADHVVVFPQMIMKRPGEYMMIAFFQTMFVFGHRPWKVADPKTKDHMGVGAFNLVRRSVYEAVGTYEALRMEVLDDMKLGKVVKNAGLRAAQCFRRGLDFDSLGGRRDGSGEQPDQEFLRGVVFPVAANFDCGVWIGLPESDAVSRSVAGAWVGAVALCGGAGIDVLDLSGHVVAVGGSGILLCAASHQHGAVYLHVAPLHVPCVVERRDYLARDEISAGGVAEGDGVSVHCGGSPFTSASLP